MVRLCYAFYIYKVRGPSVPQCDDPTANCLDDSPMAVYCKNNCDDLLIQEPNTGICQHLGLFSKPWSHK